jgi:disulfide bond formation protein DsbB
MNYLVFILSGVVLVASYYFEYGLGLTPCPLCIMQRGCIFILLGFSGLSVLPLTKRFNNVYFFIQSLGVLGGLFFSVRQLWLQSLPPDQVPACMPDLSILMAYFPIQDVLKTMILGTGDCAKVPWTFLGFSMPFYALLYFLTIGLLLIGQKIKSRPSHVVE